FGALSEQDILRIAASLDQLSAHVLARSLTTEVAKRGISLTLPSAFQEHLGDGVSGVIDGTMYFFGRMSFVGQNGAQVTDAVQNDHEEIRGEGGIAVLLADEKTILGSIHFTDTVRPDVGALFRNIESLGIDRVIMLTGDKQETALRVAQEIGLKPENIRAEMLPDEKVEEVMRWKEEHGPVVMVGDGVNDAPAIAEADVGIAMGGRGSTASSEAGDIVILIDRIERVG